MSCQLDANFALGALFSFLFFLFDQITRKYPDQTVVPKAMKEEAHPDRRGVWRRSAASHRRARLVTLCTGSHSLPCGMSKSLYTGMYFKNLSPLFRPFYYVTEGDNIPVRACAPALLLEVQSAFQADVQHPAVRSPLGNKRL